MIMISNGLRNEIWIYVKNNFNGRGDHLEMKAIDVAKVQLFLLQWTKLHS